MDSEKETLTPEGFVPLFHDPDLPASFFLGKMLEGFQGMFRVWLTSDEGQNVLRESIEPYVQLVVDKMAERLRGEINEEIERAVQNSDIENYRNELEGMVSEEARLQQNIAFETSDFKAAVEREVGVLIDTDNIETVARDAAREALETVAEDAARDAAVEYIENATYTVEVSV